MRGKSEIGVVRTREVRVRERILAVHREGMCGERSTFADSQLGKSEIGVVRTREV
jgi:hypothetical protein